VHEAAVLLGYRRFVFPSQSEVESDGRLNAKIVGQISVGERLTEILVRIPECERTCRGNAQQKVGKVISCRCARKRKAAARILLGHQIEFLSPKIKAVTQRVTSFVQCAGVEHSARLVPIECIGPARKPRETAGEIQTRRTPVSWIAIVSD